MKMFEVLDLLDRWGRAGVPVTSVLAANQLQMSVYRVRKTMRSLREVGLVDWDYAEHRPQVQKRLYRTTVRGRAVLAAYQDYAPPSMEVIS